MKNGPGSKITREWFSRRFLEENIETRGTETASEEEASQEEQGWWEEAAMQGGHLSYYYLSGDICHPR